MENKNEKFQNGVMKLDTDELESVAGGHHSSTSNTGFIYLAGSSTNESGDLPLYKVGDYVTYYNPPHSCYAKAIVLETGWTYEHQIVSYYNLHEMFPTVF